MFFGRFFSSLIVVTKTMGQKQSLEHSSPVRLLSSEKFSGLQIAIFSWNTESVSFSKDVEFIRVFAKKITKPSKPDIIVIQLQEDSSDSQLATEGGLFEREFIDYGYIMKGSFAEMGIGLTTFTKRKMRGLRTIIFVKENLENVVNLDQRMTHFCSSTPTHEKISPMISQQIKGKGGLGVAAILNGEKKALFVNVHLPFSHSTFEDKEKRKSGIAFQINCLSAIVNSMIQKENPDFLFIAGDFNFRISPFIRLDGVAGNKRSVDESLKLLNDLAVEHNLSKSVMELNKFAREGNFEKCLDILRSLSSENILGPYQKQFNNLVIDKKIGDAIEVLDRFVSEKNLPSFFKLQTADEWSASMFKMKKMEHMDHFADEFKKYKHIIGLKEGIDDSGPDFFPTCKMCKMRKAGCPHSKGLCNKCEKENHSCESCFALCHGKEERFVGWCDRIFYETFNMWGNISCVEYDRFDVAEMNQSDHAAVYGKYNISDSRI